MKKVCQFCCGFNETSAIFYKIVKVLLISIVFQRYNFKNKIKKISPLRDKCLHFVSQVEKNEYECCCLDSISACYIIIYI